MRNLTVVRLPSHLIAADVLFAAFLVFLPLHQASIHFVVLPEWRYYFQITAWLAGYVAQTLESMRLQYLYRDSRLLLPAGQISGKPLADQRQL